MKLLLIFFLLPLYSLSQCTGTILEGHYEYTPGASGLGISIGRISEEDPFKATVGVSCIRYPGGYKGYDSVKTIGRVDATVGVRVFRKEYKYSLYSSITMTMDLHQGICILPSIEFLIPWNTKAFYLKPLYNLTTHTTHLQAGLYFKI